MQYTLGDAFLYSTVLREHGQYQQFSNK